MLGTHDKMMVTGQTFKTDYTVFDKLNGDAISSRRCRLNQAGLIISVLLIIKISGAICVLYSGTLLVTRQCSLEFRVAIVKKAIIY